MSQEIDPQSLDHIDQTAFDDLYATHAGMIYRLGWSMLHDKQAAEDVVQETFLRAYRARDHFDPQRAKPGTWLYQIALNYCRSHLRRKRLPTIPWIAETIHSPQPQHPDLNPETRLLRAEYRQALWQAINTLSPPLKEVVVLHYYLELPAVEIARILSCPSGTIYSRLHNARRQLAQAMDKAGFPATEATEVPHAF